jgi:hypothetical protein
VTLARVLVGILLGLLAATCAPTNVPADAADDIREEGLLDADLDAPDNAAAIDAPDVVYVPMCTSNGVCGAGGFCDRRFPLAVCSRACTTIDSCGPMAVCLRGTCVPACSGPGDCDAFGGTCMSTGSGGPSACVPACVADPANVPFRCMSPLVCDPTTHECTASTAHDAGD